MSESRLALELEGVRYFVMPSTTGYVCLMTDDAQMPMVDCASPSDLANVDRYMAMSGNGSRSIRVMIVPDEYSHAEIDGRTIDAVDNVLAFPTGIAGIARIIGPHQSVSIDLPGFPSPAVSWPSTTTGITPTPTDARVAPARPPAPTVPSGPGAASP